MRKLAAILATGAIVVFAQAPVPRRVMRTDGVTTIGPNGQFPPGQQPPAQPEYSGPRGSLSGIVSDSVTGMPLKKAQVRVSFAGPPSVVVTDGSGSFTFEQLPPGNYVVFANHPAYPPSFNARQAPEQVTLAPGEQKRGLTVTLVPGVSVSGRITEEDGDPLANCNVSLITRTQQQNFQPMQMANTNANGEYTISNVAAGRYYMQARCTAPYLQPRAFAAPNAIPTGSQFAYAPNFYPGTPTFSGAQKIKLTPGQQARGLDFRMSLQSVTTVLVHVKGLDEEHSGRLFANLVPVDSPVPTHMGLGGMMQPRTGILRLPNVPPGTYTLLLNSNGQDRSVIARETIQVGDEPREITIQIQPLCPLSGVIHKEAPPPNSNPVFQSKQPNGNGMITLSQVDEQGNALSAPVAEDGSFTLKSTIPGRYRVSAMGGFVQSVDIGGETTDGSEFVLKQGATGPLTINVGFGTGTLSGEVQLGESHPSQVLILANAGQGSHSTLVSSVSAGQPLKYSFPLPPGSYRVYALAVTDPKAIDQLMLSDALQGRDESVQVRVSAETTRNLKLVTKADFEKADQ